jgi:ABC-type Mn2+/Zn2+ transport system permease subunit
MAIVLAALGIAIGTPIAAAFLIHKRHVFFVQAPSASSDKETSHKA